MLVRKPPSLVLFLVCAAVSVVAIMVVIKMSVAPWPPSENVDVAIHAAVGGRPGKVFIDSVEPGVARNELDAYRRETETALNHLNERLRVQRALLEELACGQTGIGARGGFCLKTDNIDVGGNSAWDPTLSKKLDQLFAGQSVGDFGAGLGWYGRYLLRAIHPVFVYGKNVEQTQLLNRTTIMENLKATPQSVKSWHGFDGAGNVELVTGRFVRFLDLTEEQDLPVKFDWVMSLEVGEHIPPSYEDIFVNNLVKHACKGIFLSWAVEGQGGHHHVNNHNNDHIKKMMAAKGFVSNQKWEDKLREGVELGWFSNTLMVFDRTPPLVHPKCKSAKIVKPVT